MADINELNLDEMENVSGGRGGSKTILPAQPGLSVYQIVKGDNLTRIASAHRCTITELLKWNPKITNKNVIYAGDFLYIKVK